MKIFAVRDEDNTTNKAVAYLFYYEKEKRFYIELLKELYHNGVTLAANLRHSRSPL